VKTKMRCISKTHTTPLRGIHTPGETVPTFWTVEFSSEHDVVTLTINRVTGVKASQFNVGMVYDMEIGGEDERGPYDRP